MDSLFLTAATLIEFVLEAVDNWMILSDGDLDEDLVPCSVDSDESCIILSDGCSLTTSSFSHLEFLKSSVSELDVNFSFNFLAISFNFCCICSISFSSLDSTFFAPSLSCDVLLFKSITALSSLTVEEEVNVSALFVDFGGTGASTSFFLTTSLT